MSFEEKNVKAEVRLHEFDHRELNKKHHYYHLDDEIGAGLPLWLPAGVVIRDELEKLAKEMELENKAYRLRPMCCPHHHKIYDSRPRSYRDLPLRFAEYGQVYRYERSGVLSGLMRVRGLCQNDAHIYCRPDQVKEELRKVLRMYLKAYEILGISDYRLRLSKADLSGKDSSKYVPEPEKWAEAEGILRDVLIDMELPYEEVPGEAAFYGPKIDVQLQNIYGREESASTVQLDFSSAARFDLFYIDENDQKVQPWIIHRAPLGSHERFVAFLIEKFKGSFPLWLAPVQVKILNIADRHRDYAEQLRLLLHNSFVRVEIDDRLESLGKKMADARIEGVPCVCVIGDKEVQEVKLSVRWSDGRQEKLMPEELLNLVRERIQRRE